MCLFIKRLVWLVFVLLAASSVEAAQEVPILRGKLQSDLNGNQQSITNLAKVVATNFYGDGSGLTNISGSDGSAPSFTNSATLWVDLSGVDATAVRGVRELPWKNLELAVSNAVAGDTIIVNQGTYPVTNGLFLPKGGAKLIGVGRPTIEHYATNTALLKNFGIVITDNSTVENFAISNMHKSTRYQLSIGTHNNLNWGTTLTNVVLRNVIGDGDSDSFFVKASNTVQIAMYDCRFYSKWDALVLIGESGYTPLMDVALFNCLSVVYTESVFNPGMSGYTHALGFDGNPKVKLFVSGGYYASTNNSVGYVFMMRSGNPTSFEAYLVGTKMIGTNWLYMEDAPTGAKLRITGSQLTGGVLDGSSAGTVNYAVFSDNLIGLQNSLSIVDTPATAQATWTNTWGSDGGLMLGGTNLVGKANLRVVGTERVTGRITNDALISSKGVFSDSSGTPALTSSGTLGPAQGGTGLNTYQNTNQGGLLYLSSSNGVYDFTTNNGGVASVLHRSPAGFGIATGAPYWAKVNLTPPSDVTGVLPTANIDWGNNLSSSRIVMTGPGATDVTSASGSGQFPVDADGSLTTAGQIDTLLAGKYVASASGFGTNVTFKGAMVSNDVTGNAIVMTNGAVTINLSNAPAVGQYGFDGTNKVVATVGNQQYSPFIHLAGNGWKTTATAGSQPVEWAMGVVPVQGTANPTALLVTSNSVNNAAYSTISTLDSSGATGWTLFSPSGNANDYIRIGAAGNSRGIAFSANALGQSASLIGDSTASGGPFEERMGSGGSFSWRSTTRADAGSTDTTMGRSAAGVVYVGTTGTTPDGSLRLRVGVTAKTSNYSVLTTDSNTHFNNSGAAGTVNFTLPAAAIGLTYVFYIDAAQTFTITAGTGDTIRIAGSASASAGNITSSTIGNCITLVCHSANHWVAEAHEGTWTIN